LPGVLLSLLLTGTARSEDIVLGMSAAFTGPSGGLGSEFFRGASAYFEHVNRSGGIHGRKVVIKALDDGYQPAPAVANTIRLIRDEHVFVLFGYVGTPTVTRVAPLLKTHEEESVCLFCPFTGGLAVRLPPYDAFVFNFRASYAQETAGLVENFLKVGRKRVAVFYQIDAFGRSGWAGVRAALARHDLRLAGEATYRRGAVFAQSFRPQVDLLREAGADAVISVGTYEACAGFIRDARDAGWDVPIANVSGVGSESLLSLLLEHGRSAGKDYTAGLINSQVVPSYHEVSLPAVAEYRELMARYAPPAPVKYPGEGVRIHTHSFVGLEGFLSAKLLAEVLKRLGPDPRRENVKAAAESLGDVDLGLGGAVSLRRGRHQASDRVYYTVVKEGRFVTLKDWEAWGK
jgi:ABC-type branched-subunit amino acid transport system substrate-binding protein